MINQQLFTAKGDSMQHNVKNIREILQLLKISNAYLPKINRCGMRFCGEAVIIYMI